MTHRAVSPSAAELLFAVVLCGINVHGALLVDEGDSCGVVECGGHGLTVSGVGKKCWVLRTEQRLKSV